MNLIYFVLMLFPDCLPRDNQFASLVCAVHQDLGFEADLMRDKVLTSCVLVVQKRRNNYEARFNVSKSNSSYWTITKLLGTGGCTCMKACLQAAHSQSDVCRAKR
jgi:hypothetical protein